MIGQARLGKNGRQMARDGESDQSDQAYDFFTLELSIQIHLTLSPPALVGLHNQGLRRPANQTKPRGPIEIH